MKPQKQSSAQCTWTARSAEKLFVGVADAFGLGQDPEVTRATGMLAGKQYASFLALTDTWASQQYGSAAETAVWCQLACLLKKYPFDDPSIDRKAAALKKFALAETRCKRINQRFKAYQEREKHLASRPGKRLPYHAQIHRARTWITRVIGAEPNLPELLGMSGFCPGTSIGKNGDLTHAAAKLSAPIWPITPGAVPYVVAALVGDHRIVQFVHQQTGLYDGIWPEDLQPHFLPFTRELVHCRLQLTSYNKIVTVPKTATSDRTIAVEPLMNGFMQKGADEYLRACLRRVGIDLGNQTANQLMAQAGSDTSRLDPFCTIDLSMASDSLATEVARLLLPPAWFDLLLALRSPEYLLPGETQPRKYHKFASMGNGFCFPLETLIFASIVVAAYEVTGHPPQASREFRVYGDDIIVRQSAALLVLELLRYVGFKPNVDKTFVFGPFRESCGADFFEGENVRPYYLDSIPKSYGDMFGILNALTRKGLGQEGCWWDLFNSIPPGWRYCRPHSGPDTAITVPRDIFMASKFAKWNVDEQRWSWTEILPIAVLDDRYYEPAVEMYGALAGADAIVPKTDKRHRLRKDTIRAYLPAFAFRRKTRTLRRLI